MKARHVARELALLLFSQLETYENKISKKDFENIILDSVRILTNNSDDELKKSLGDLIDIKNYIDNYEANDESNLSRPIGVKDRPVAIPTTQDMREKLDTIIDTIDKTMFALEIAELVTLESQEDVKSYVIDIAKSFRDNHKEIDEIIQQYSKGWDINRLVKMDKDILRISLIELLFLKDAPMKVVIDEALELAKKYSTDESSSFINGVLAKVIMEKGLG